jgi:hypothetical protein
MELTLEQMIDNYVKIRDAKDKAKKAFTVETERMTAALTKLDGLILAKLEGAESIKTECGTAYTKKRTSCSVKDREAFYKFALDTGNLGAIDMKANAKAVRELQEAGTVVPGVNYSEALVVGVRRPKQ